MELAAPGNATYSFNTSLPYLQEEGSWKKSSLNMHNTSAHRNINNESVTSDDSSLPFSATNMPMWHLKLAPPVSWTHCSPKCRYDGQADDAKNALEAAQLDVTNGVKNG